MMATNLWGIFLIVAVGLTRNEVIGTDQTRYSICDKFAPSSEQRKHALDLADYAPGDEEFASGHIRKAFIDYYAVLFCPPPVQSFAKPLSQLADTRAAELLEKALREAVAQHYTPASRELQEMSKEEQADGEARFFLGTIQWAQGKRKEASLLWYRAARTTGETQPNDGIVVPAFVHSARYMLTHLSKTKPPTWTYGRSGISNSDQN